MKYFTNHLSEIAYEFPLPPHLPPGTNTSTSRIHNPLLSPNLSNLSGAEAFQRLITLGISIGFVIGAVVFVFLLIIGGIKWITSGGDKSAAESAQKTITHAVIGLAILFSVFAIITLIETLFGVSITSFNLPTL